MSDLEELVALTIECGFEIRRDLGPGLLESCYLKLLNLPLGLVMNFGGGTFHQGLKRVANNYRA